MMIAPQARVATNLYQLYQDESKDPCKRNYARVMQRFDAMDEDAAAVPGNTLFQQIVNRGGKVLQSFLCCGRSMNGPRIFTLHLPSKFLASIDGAPSVWDDRCFAFKGDVVQGMVSIVNFPEDAFDLVTERVKTLPYMVGHLAELDNIPLFPPLIVGENETEEITTRKFMFLPAAYAPLLLQSRGYSIKEVWDVLYPALIQRDEVDICRPLLQWLQMSSSSTELANPGALGEPSNVITLTVPAADEQLLSHTHSVLHQALPGLSAPPYALETALSQMATAIVAQTNDARQAREQKLAEDRAEKLPSERFTVTLPVLLEYLEVADERNLPDIWTRWANCTKRQEMQVFRDSLDAFARSPDAYTSTVPLVTARLTQDMLSFSFVGQSADDLKGGLHPFIIVDGNAEHRQTNVEVARLYGLLTAGDATCTLADLEALNAKEIKSVPITYWELESTLGMFGNLMSVILGVRHPLATAYRQMWLLMQSQLKSDLHMALEYKAYVKPTHLLRSVQLIFYTWFTHRRARLAPPTPDFTTVLHQIIMQTYVLPNLPYQLYQLAYPKRTYATSDTVPGSVATSSSGSTSASGLSSVGLVHTTASVVSDITNRSGGGNATQPGRGARIANLHPIPAIVNLVPSTIKLKDIIGDSSPPTLDNGSDMCLSFLLKNGCWSNCKRAQNHTAALTANEQQRLTQYLTRRLATRNTPSGTPYSTPGVAHAPAAPTQLTSRQGTQNP